MKKIYNLLFCDLNELPIEDAQSLISDVVVHELSLDSEKLPSFILLIVLRSWLKLKWATHSLNFIF